jgi:hypothetical protein
MKLLRSYRDFPHHPTKIEARLWLVWLVTLLSESGNAWSQSMLVNAYEWPEPRKKHRPLRRRPPDGNVQGLMTISMKTLDHETGSFSPLIACQTVS